jgi:hypothetical protein
VNRYWLAYELISGVCLTGLGVSWLVYGLEEQAGPWWIGVGAFVLLGGLGYLFSGYRRLRRPPEQE